MDLELAFATAVFNASEQAKTFRLQGWHRTTSDEIDTAIATLSTCLEALGCPERVDAIIRRHVIEHRDGTYSPRHRPGKNVVRFPWRHRIGRYTPVSA